MIFSIRKSICLEMIIPNLIESERKGGALSTIILLVINADDQSITKIIGIILKI